MALGVKRKRVPQDEDFGYLSDESDFYGDEATKYDFEARARDFNVSLWWKHQTPSLTAIANRTPSPENSKEEVKLYNPYEGQICGRQLNETVEDFLERLPPQTTPCSDSIPWIYISNPYRKAKLLETKDRAMGEAPPNDNGDLDLFVERGEKLLGDLRVLRKQLENQRPDAAKATITRAFNPKKEPIVKKIIDAAVECHCTTGKWMLFCDPSEVNEVWSVVARYTATNELGIAAKVAPFPEDGDIGKYRLICVYTKDFTDTKDVSRVVSKMKDLGLIDARGRGIYYKADAYTYLGLTGDNQYGIKMSMYSSAEVLKSKPEQAKDLQPKVYSSSKKKEPIEDDWEL